MISGPFFYAAIPALRWLPAMDAAGAPPPEPSKSPQTRPSPLSVLCLAFGWTKANSKRNQALAMAGSPSIMASGRRHSWTVCVVCTNVAAIDPAHEVLP